MSYCVRIEDCLSSKTRPGARTCGVPRTSLALHRISSRASPSPPSIVVCSKSGSSIRCSASAALQTSQVIQDGSNLNLFQLTLDPIRIAEHQAESDDETAGAIFALASMPHWEYEPPLATPLEQHTAGTSSNEGRRFSRPSRPSVILDDDFSTEDARMNPVYRLIRKKELQLRQRPEQPHKLTRSVIHSSGAESDDGHISMSRVGSPASVSLGGGIFKPDVMRTPTAHLNPVYRMIRKTELQLKQKKRSTRLGKTQREEERRLKAELEAQYALGYTESSEQFIPEMGEHSSQHTNRVPSTPSSVILDSELASAQARLNPVYRLIRKKELQSRQQHRNTNSAAAQHDSTASPTPLWSSVTNPATVLVNSLQQIGQHQQQREPQRQHRSDRAHFQLSEQLSESQSWPERPQQEFLPQGFTSHDLSTRFRPPQPPVVASLRPLFPKSNPYTWDVEVPRQVSNRITQPYPDFDETLGTVAGPNYIPLSPPRPSIPLDDEEALNASPTPLALIPPTGNMKVDRTIRTKQLQLWWRQRKSAEAAAAGAHVRQVHANTAPVLLSYQDLPQSQQALQLNEPLVHTQETLSQQPQQAEQQQQHVYREEEVSEHPGHALQGQIERQHAQPLEVHLLKQLSSTVSHDQQQLIENNIPQLPPLTAADEESVLASQTPVEDDLQVSTTSISTALQASVAAELEQQTAAPVSHPLPAATTASSPKPPAALPPTGSARIDRMIRIQQLQRWWKQTKAPTNAIPIQEAPTLPPLFLGGFSSTNTTTATSTASGKAARQFLPPLLDSSKQPVSGNGRYKVSRGLQAILTQNAEEPRGVFGRVDLQPPSRNSTPDTCFISGQMPTGLTQHKLTELRVKYPSMDVSGLLVRKEARRKRDAASAHGSHNDPLPSGLGTGSSRRFAVASDAAGNLITVESQNAGNSGDESRTGGAQHDGIMPSPYRASKSITGELDDLLVGMVEKGMDERRAVSLLAVKLKSAGLAHLGTDLPSQLRELSASLGLSLDVVARCAVKHPALLLKTGDALSWNLSSLAEALGKGESSVLSLVTQYPALLHVSAERVAMHLESLQTLLDLTPAEASEMAEAHPAILGLNPHTLAAKVQGLADLLDADLGLGGVTSGSSDSSNTVTMSNSTSVSIQSLSSPVTTSSDVISLLSRPIGAVASASITSTPATASEASTHSAPADGMTSNTSTSRIIEASPTSPATDDSFPAEAFVPRHPRTSKISTLLHAFPTLLGVSLPTLASKSGRLAKLMSVWPPWQQQLVKLSPKSLGRVLASSHAALDRLSFILQDLTSSIDTTHNSGPRIRTAGSVRPTKYATSSKSSLKSCRACKSLVNVRDLLAPKATIGRPLKLAQASGAGTDHSEKRCRSCNSLISLQDPDAPQVRRGKGRPPKSLISDAAVMRVNKMPSISTLLTISRVEFETRFPGFDRYLAVSSSGGD